MILNSSLRLAVTMTPGDGKGHPDQYSPSGLTAGEPKLDLGGPAH